MIPANLIPMVFGLLMAGIDIAMMGLAKLTHLRKLPYASGLALSTAIYALQPFLFLKGLSFESMTVMNLIWNLVSSVVVTLLGVFYFGETVKGVRWVAILLGLFSLGLFAFTDE